VRGKWSVKAAYATKDGQLLADNATTLRVTRP
jgi:hypothetical protein